MRDRQNERGKEKLGNERKKTFPIWWDWKFMLRENHREIRKMLKRKKEKINRNERENREI